MSSVEAVVTIHVVSRRSSGYMSSSKLCGEDYSAEQVDSIQQNEEIVARINTRQIRKSLIKISFDSSPHEKPPFDMCIHAKTNS
jgi:hypothetical protein